MWRISESQRVVLRLGAVMCLLAVPILLVVVWVSATAWLEDPEVVPVDDVSAPITLPAPGPLGEGRLTFYGATGEPFGPAPRELGCRLVGERGQDRGGARLSDLAVLGQGAVTVDGEELSPMFEVHYVDGDRLECDGLDHVRPVVHSAPSTFGSSALMVTTAAGGGAVVFAFLGLVGVVLLRPRHH